MICPAQQAGKILVNSPVLLSEHFTKAVKLPRMSGIPYGHAPSDPATLIRAERLRRNWTLEELAERVGVTAQTLGRWETEERQISVVKLARVAKAFGLPTKMLVPGDDGLSPDERNLLEWYRGASVYERKAVSDLMRSLHEGRQAEFEARKEAS